jgi:hypothetical protein
MAAVDLGAVMQAIADRLVAAGVVTRAYGYPVGSVQPPCAVVGYPEELDFDATFGRGSDRAVLPVWIVAGATHDRTTRDVLSAYIGDGARSVKAALEPNVGGAVQTARVTDCQVEKLPIGAVEYMAAKFMIEVYS